MMRAKAKPTEPLPSQLQARDQPHLSSVVPASTPEGSAALWLDLQRTHGNRLVQRLLSSAAAAEGRENAAHAITAEPDLLQAAELTPQGKPSVVQVELEPHRGTEAELRALAPFYRAGKTPFLDAEGTLRTFEVAPADAATAGHQLGTIQQRFGAQGVKQTLDGLTLTRGHEFAAAAVRYSSSAVARTAKAAMVDEGDSEESEPLSARAGAFSASAPSAPGRVGAGQERTVGHDVARLLAHSGTGTALPAAIRKQFAPLAGEPLRDVRLHRDSAANAAADLLNARAFTIGRSIYFAAGEFDPRSASGRHLLAHELAHTVQQRQARWPSLDSLRVSSKSDSEESEADRFADLAVRSSPRHAPPTLTAAARVARVQRAIRFTRSNDTFTTNALTVNETAGGFTIRRNTAPLFGWFADVTINGNAGDPFANFEVGPHQVVRNFRGVFTWGSGANLGRRVLTCSTLPIRDATAAANTWYHDPFAQAFTANGDVRNSGLNDSPSPGTQPWNNPVAGKVGNTGTFAFTAAFVAYISARDTTAGTGAAAFRALNCLYWNSSISGNFDASQALGSRVNASGGGVNRGGIISGASGEFPSMHGGAIANNSFTTTDT